MITEDIAIAKEIFSLLDAGIVENYVAFKFEAEVYDLYVERELTVQIAGVEYTNADTNINGAILCELLEKLKANGKKRGENWEKIIMSYRHGGEVKTRFEYPDQESAD